MALDVVKLKKLITERIAGKDASVVANALACFNAGYAHELGGMLEPHQADRLREAGLDGAGGLRPHSRSTRGLTR